MTDSVSNSGNQFTYNGHISHFRDCIVDSHPTSKSMHKFRVYNCKTKSVEITDFRSCGNGSMFGYINGKTVKIHSYGLNVKETF